MVSVWNFNDFYNVGKSRGRFSKDNFFIDEIIEDFEFRIDDFLK